MTKARYLESNGSCDKMLKNVCHKDLSMSNLIIIILWSKDEHLNN
jgi:hypothetical protein